MPPIEIKMHQVSSLAEYWRDHLGKTHEAERRKLIFPNSMTLAVRITTIEFLKLKRGFS